MRIVFPSTSEVSLVYVMSYQGINEETVVGVGRLAFFTCYHK